VEAACVTGWLAVEAACVAGSVVVEAAGVAGWLAVDEAAGGAGSVVVEAVCVACATGSVLVEAVCVACVTACVTGVAVPAEPGGVSAADVPVAATTDVADRARAAAAFRPLLILLVDVFAAIGIIPQWLDRRDTRWRIPQTKSAFLNERRVCRVADRVAPPSANAAPATIRSRTRGNPCAG
jgi:hypothetical protein